MQERTQRIAQNTLFLYIRTLVIMLVSLYTSRVILHILGAVDFGIYNIVGGIIVLFSFINSAMTSSTQRFLNYEIGARNITAVQKVFSTSLLVHIYIAIFLIVLGETIGLWLLNTKINIPQERIYAAQWVYQFSLLGCCLSIVRVPYNACIIAYERMSFYAWISIIEAILKLGIVYILYVALFDKLILYSILIFIITLLITVIYQIYCRRHFKITKYTPPKDTYLLRKLLSFSGWSLFGSAANIGMNQGLNILLNIFFGVVINAAIGIANQVNSAIYTFVSNFQTAFIPQIVKSYAANDNTYFSFLINRTSRFSFLLLFVISYPIFWSCHWVLSIWLVDVPNMTVEFVQLIILCSLFDALSGPLWSAVQASGNINKYQLTISILLLLSLPISFIALKAGLSAIYVFTIKMIISLATFLYRLIYLKYKLSFNLRFYIKTVLIRCFAVLIISTFIAVFLLYASNFNELAKLIILILIGCSTSYFVGLDHSEKTAALNFIKTKLRK